MSKVDDFINEYLDDAAKKNFIDVGTIEEKQLIALLMIRNNLRKQGRNIEAIGHWVIVIGMIAILGLIVGGCSALAMF